ncbi:ATP-binding protein [Streptomyces sp. NPDC051041]|uniref:ATP-binding protein n=1 Tax=Streptomyces sp. NPDC051041 TaxID=3365640 RepID=UPI0037AA123A
MKQSAVRTLGVAALGAAFAAAGAGAANAAPALPDAAQTLGTVTQALPAETVTQAVPGGSAALEQGQGTAEAALTTVQPVAEQVLAERLSQIPVQPVAELLGGLPAHGLPVTGLPVA